MKRKIFSIIISIIVTLGILITLINVKKGQLLIEEKNSKLVATQEVNKLSNNLQTILNVSMQYVEFFNIVIKNNPNISFDLIENYANSILKYNNIINNISIAPDGVVKYIYPKEGNEDAIGHNLLEDPERKKYIEICIETKEAVTQGPVEAVQGGLKIFNRKAIFIHDDGKDKFWGICAVTVDFDKLLDVFGISSEKDNYLYAIRVSKVNENEDFNWGCTEIFNKNAIVKNIYLPNQDWEIAIYPKAGWNGSTSISFSVYLILIIIFIIIYFYINHYQQIKEAAKLDPLTGILNKKYFEKYAKRRMKKNNKYHGLILIDLNKFKNINDKLGHPIGDRVLKETVNRIKLIVSDNDKLGRIGGDEFFLFINDVKDQKEIDKIIKSIENKMKVPMEFGDIKVEVSCSLGLAIYNKDSTSYNELYKIADKRMYEKKQHEYLK